VLWPNLINETSSVAEQTVYKHVTIKGRQENTRDNEGDRKKAGIRRHLRKNEKRGFRKVRNEY
jgi:hypothetical protein